MTQEDEQREQFIDAMYNYFGIEEEGELKYFGDIFDSVFLPFVQSNFISKASVREAIHRLENPWSNRRLSEEDMPMKKYHTLKAKQFGYSKAVDELRNNLGLSEEGKKDGK